MACNAPGCCPDQTSGVRSSRPGHKPAWEVGGRSGPGFPSAPRTTWYLAGKLSSPESARGTGRDTAVKVTKGTTGRRGGAGAAEQRSQRERKSETPDAARSQGSNKEPPAPGPTGTTCSSQEPRLIRTRRPQTGLGGCPHRQGAGTRPGAARRGRAAWRRRGVISPAAPSGPEPRGQRPNVWMQALRTGGTQRRHRPRTHPTWDVCPEVSRTQHWALGGVRPGHGHAAPRGCDVLTAPPSGSREAQKGCVLMETQSPRRALRLGTVSPH